MTGRQPRLDIGVFGARSIPSTYSGYETFLTAFLPELVRRGHTVTMYSRQREHRGDYEGVRRRYVPSIDTKQLDTLSHGAIAAVRSRFARHDVVFACNVANAFFLPALTWTGTPTVLNVDGQEWKRDKWGSFARATFHRAARLSPRSATTLVTDCEAMREIYLDEFGTDSVAIPYPHHDLQPPERLAGEAVLATFGLRPNGYVLVAARHNPENNIVPVTRSHIETESPLPIVVLGTANYDSPVGRDLRDLMARDERVVAPGHVDDRSTFAALLQNAAIYYHGHSVGGINPSLIEAMGVGALVAAYDTPFNREALGDTGLYFDDPTTAASTIHARLRIHDPGRLRTAAADRARSTFSMKEIVDRYEAVFIDAARSKRRRRRPQITGPAGP